MNTLIYDPVKWDQRFMRLAHETLSWSKDPSTKVGCVIVRDRRILSSGYNGFPRGIYDLADRYNNRPVKYNYTIHAEANALCNATREGISCDSATLYIVGLPVCHECAKLIIQSGITRVVIDSRSTDVSRDQRWKESTELAMDLFKESGVQYNSCQDYDSTAPTFITGK